MDSMKDIDLPSTLAGYLIEARIWTPERIKSPGPKSVNLRELIGADAGPHEVGAARAS
jgi:hypothetical protein